jgi:hypothetical protein
LTNVISKSHTHTLAANKGLPLCTAPKSTAASTVASAAATRDVSPERAVAVTSATVFITATTDG